jgi:hypothetical protein
MRVAAVYNGSAAHHRSLNLPKYARWIDELIYLPGLPGADLSHLDCLILPEGLHQGIMEKSRPNLLGFLEEGGTLVVFGDQPVYGKQPQGWLPGISWVDRPVNYWWWREPGASSGLVAHLPEHSFWSRLDLSDATWHQHGAFHAPDGAEVLITNEEGLAVAYIDRVGTPGTLVVLSLDPMYHFGSYFMPATERFLDGFLPWLAEDLPAAVRG